MEELIDEIKIIANELKKDIDRYSKLVNRWEEYDLSYRFRIIAEDAIDLSKEVSRLVETYGDKV